MALRIPLFYLLVPDISSLIGSFVLIHRLARRIFQAPRTISRILWLYALLFPPLYAMLGFFDGVALFFMLLALDLLLDNRRFPSAIMVGVGFMVKIIPVLILPIALRHIWHQYQKNNKEAATEAALYTITIALTVLFLLAPFLLLGPQWVLASARSMINRSSWETVWAIIEGYYGFGRVAGDRFNPAETNFTIYESVAPGLLPIVTLAFIGIYTFLFIRPANYSRPRNLVAFSGLAISLFMLASKGYSPQFLVYLLPFILLLFPNGRGITYALLLTGLNVLEQPIYFVMLPTLTWLLTFIVVSRFLLLILVALECALALWPSAKPLAPVIKLRRIPASVVAGTMGVTALILGLLLLNAYRATHQQSSPAVNFAHFMQALKANTSQNFLPIPTTSNPLLLLSDQPTYRQIYPHLRNEFDLRLADGAAKYKAAPTILDLLEGVDTVWLLPTGPAEETLNTVSERSQLLAAYTFEGLGTVSLHTFQNDPILPFIPPARFSNGIELLAHQVENQSGQIDVTLYWQAREPQNQNLVVFTQLLDPTGQRIAGHDGIPTNGNTPRPIPAWPIETVQVDSHQITYPTDLQPGKYSLVVGLYNQDEARLEPIAPDGYGYENQAVPLVTISLP